MEYVIRIINKSVNKPFVCISIHVFKSTRLQMSLAHAMGKATLWNQFLGRIAVLRMQMRPIVTNRVVWYGLSVGLSQ